MADRGTETSYEGFRRHFLYLFCLSFTRIGCPVKFSVILRCVLQGESGHRAQKKSLELAQRGSVVELDPGTKRSLV